MQTNLVLLTDIFSQTHEFLNILTIHSGINNMQVKIPRKIHMLLLDSNKGKNNIFFISKQPPATRLYVL